MTRFTFFLTFQAYEIETRGCQCGCLRQMLKESPTTISVALIKLNLLGSAEDVVATAASDEESEVAVAAAVAAEESLLASAEESLLAGAEEWLVGGAGGPEHSLLHPFKATEGEGEGRAEDKARVCREEKARLCREKVGNQPSPRTCVGPSKSGMGRENERSECGSECGSVSECGSWPSVNKVVSRCQGWLAWWPLSVAPDTCMSRRKSSANTSTTTRRASQCELRDIGPEEQHAYLITPRWLRTSRAVPGTGGASGPQERAEQGGAQERGEAQEDAQRERGDAQGDAQGEPHEEGRGERQGDAQERARMLTWRHTRERHGDAQERARPHAAAKQRGEATQGGDAEQAGEAKQAGEAEVEGKRPNGRKGWGIEVGGDRNMVFVPLVGCLGVSALTICEYLPILLPFVNIVCVRSYVSVLTICEYRLVISVWFTPNIA